TEQRAPESVRAAATPQHPNWRWGPAAGVLAALLAAAGLGWAALSPRRTPKLKPVLALATRPSLAILGFANAGRQSSDAWLSPALAEMLRTEMAAGGRLRIIPGESVAAYRSSTPWADADSLSPATAQRVGRGLRSDLLVLGSITVVGDREGGRLRVDVRLQRADSGELLYVESVAGLRADFLDVAGIIGGNLRHRLGLPPVSPADSAQAAATLPANPDARRLYALGRERAQAADAVAARDFLLQAEKLEPRFPLVHLELYRAWGALGYAQRAKAEIRIAQRLVAGLPEIERLQVESAYEQSQGQMEAAAAADHALWGLQPDNIDFAEQYLVLLKTAGRLEEGRAVLDQLRRLPPPASTDPRLDYWQGMLADTPAQAQPYLDRAVAGAVASGERLQFARFRLKQCVNRIYGERPHGAEPLCQEAYEIFMAAGNRLSAADALRAIGDHEGSQGHAAAARGYYQHALTLLAQTGECEKSGVVLNNFGVLVENQGQEDEAGQLYQRAAETWGRCGDSLNQGAALGNLADVSLARGQLDAAESQYNAARRQIEGINAHGAEYEYRSLAAIHLDRGDLAAALTYAGEAQAAEQASGIPESRARLASLLGDIHLAQGDLAGARASYLQAQALMHQLGQSNVVREEQVALAGVWLEQKNYAAAAALLQPAMAAFQAGNQMTDLAGTATDLARAERGLGRGEAAAAALQTAAQAGAGSHDPNLLIPLALERARSGGAASLRQIEQALASARRQGYFLLACRARLALAEAQLPEAPAAARRELT
ncbi:MAG: tetratricopeptide repeat protein, partial [Terriglobales bacterium]